MRRGTIGSRFGLVLAGMALAASALPHARAAAVDEPPFATVNGTRISQREFQSTYSNHVRSQFYHREGISDERLRAARQEVADRLIERILLLEEAGRRKVEADRAQVDQAIAGYEKRYASSAMWQQNREAMLPGLRQRLMEQSRLENLEREVRRQAAPTQTELRQYYETHPELFTEPEKLHLHTILLKVDPSAPGTAWDAARDEAGRIVAKLRAGADFAELARIHSQDRSAAAGGDMGYLHIGMLPEALQARIDKLALGSIGDPIDVLEGIGIFRVDERIAARLRGFDDVAERARDLLLREREQQTWQAFIADLRRKADIRLTGPAETASR